MASGDKIILSGSAGINVYVDTLAYSKGYYCIGSDRNIYKSLTDDNTGNDPVDDTDEVNWKFHLNMDSITTTEKPMQLRGGTTGEHSTFTGEPREVTVNTDKKTLVVHDGVTAGGVTVKAIINTDKTVTVGSDGDFATMNEALEFLSSYYPQYKQNGINVEVKLLAGFTMTEQVAINGIDLGWITITGEDDETTIDADDFEDIPALEYHTTNTPTFSAKNGVLPTIGQLFTTTNGGTENNGVHLENSKCKVLSGCGVKNVGQYGIIASECSFAVIRDSVFSGAGGNGIYAVHSSLINAYGADASGSGDNGIHAAANSTISAIMSNASDAAKKGIFALQGSRVAAYDCTATNTGSYSVYAGRNSHIDATASDCSTDGDPTVEYFVEKGSTITMHDASGETDTNISLNTLDTDGIIYG